MAKKSVKVTEEWSGLLTKGAHAVAQDSGELYKIQPVDLETFVLSNDYLKQNLWGMSESQKDFLKNASDLDNNINFFVLFIGKGGGKNWASGVLFLYIVYQLLCMYDPHGYLNHNKAKAITLINVAINAKQAKNNFFDPLVNILKNAGQKAFKDFGFDPENDIKADSVSFPKNIEILSANSKAGGIEGYDILVALADEVDDIEFHSVERIVDTLRSSALSRFNGREKIIVISYRRYTGSSGKILEYYNSAVGRPHIYARRYSSWEFHPIYTKENFQIHFDENPEKAACIYGSVDTGSYVDSWIKDNKRIKAAMRLDRDWIIDWPLPYQTETPGTERWLAQETHGEWRQSPASEHSYRNKDGELVVLDPYNIPIKYYGDSNIQYVMIGDPAEGSEANGGDGYGLTLAHREIIIDDKKRKFVRPVIDFSFRFTGRMFEEGQVQMIAVQDLFRRLKENFGYNIKVFSSDGWNCYQIGSYIYTPNGYKKVESLLPGDEVYSRYGINKVVHTELKNDVPTKTLTTKSGLKITVTENHPLLLKTGEWKKAGDITLDDTVALQHPIGFGNHRDIDKALVYGYLIAEGDWKDYGYSQAVNFTNSEKEVRDDYVEAIQRIFPGSLYISNRGVSTARNEVVETVSKDMESGSWNKRVPEWILQSDKDTVASFLSAAYEGDGNVIVDEKGSKRGGSPILRVEYNTVSEELSKQIQLLLLQFGIKSYRKFYLRKTPKGANTSYYRVVVYGENIETFRDDIGFRSSRKKEKLNLAVSLLVRSKKSRCNNWYDRVVSIENSISTIVHMEVDGDNTYLGEGVINHNSLSLTQWIAKTYKDVIVYDKNLVEYKDYSILRDAIFGEAPPSNGKGDKETNGGIDIPWHPIVYEELRNLREFKIGKPKVDHPENNSKDVADTIAKACRLLIYEWPLMELHSAGTGDFSTDLEKRIRTNVATEEEVLKHTESLNSNLLGIGSWRNLKSEKTITLDSILPTSDW